MSANGWRIRCTELPLPTAANRCPPMTPASAGAAAPQVHRCNAAEACRNSTRRDLLTS